MLHYDKTDLSKGTDPPKSNNSKECMVCHNWVFNHGFKFKIRFAMVDMIF